MKRWIFGIGLVLLPVAYVGVCVLNQQPVEWPVLGLMVLIVLPLLVFGKRITAVEKEVNAMSDADKAKAVAKVAAKVARRQLGSD